MKHQNEFHCVHKRALKIWYKSVFFVVFFFSFRQYETHCIRSLKKLNQPIKSCILRVLLKKKNEAITPDWHEYMWFLFSVLWFYFVVPWFFFLENFFFSFFYGYVWVKFWNLASRNAIFVDVIRFEEWFVSQWAFRRTKYLCK